MKKKPVKNKAIQKPIPKKTTKEKALKQVLEQQLKKADKLEAVLIITKVKTKFEVHGVVSPEELAGMVQAASNALKDVMKQATAKAQAN
jgi:ribosomal protein L9